MTTIYKEISLYQLTYRGFVLSKPMDLRALIARFQSVRKLEAKGYLVKLVGKRFVKAVPVSGEVITWKAA